MLYRRREYTTLIRRLEEKRRFMQIVIGPRQIGKTTLIKQVLGDLKERYLYCEVTRPQATAGFIRTNWDLARETLSRYQLNSVILVFDEIQLIPQWSEYVKKEWDDDTFHDRNIKVVLSGSSRLLLLNGLNESMMGRYEMLHMAHWDFGEIHENFGLDFDDYILSGGYPVIADMLRDATDRKGDFYQRIRNYVNNSLLQAIIRYDLEVDTDLGKGKSVLLERLLEMGCRYSGQIVSVNKLAGELQEAKSRLTIAKYLKLLEESCTLSCLQKYAADAMRRRASAPKLQVWSNALKLQYLNADRETLRSDHAEWGRIFESAVGAYLVGRSYVEGFEVHYWREGSLEVDFVLQKGSQIVALEVKSNRETYTEGMGAFIQKFRPQRTLVVGPAGIRAEDFMSMPVSDVFDRH